MKYFTIFLKNFLIHGNFNVFNKTLVLRYILIIFLICFLKFFISLMRYQLQKTVYTCLVFYSQLLSLRHLFTQTLTKHAVDQTFLGIRRCVTEIAVVYFGFCHGTLFPPLNGMIVCPVSLGRKLLATVARHFLFH